MQKLIDVQHELALKEARENFHRNPKGEGNFENLILALNRSGLHQEV
jgi:hypothetical protein